MGFVVCCNFVFFFASFVCIRFGTFDVCHCSLPIHTASHTHIVGSLLFSRTRAHVLRLRPSGGEIRSTKTCAAASLLLLCVCFLCDCFVFLFKFAQTLTIVPRVALNWYTVFLLVCWFYVSFSLTKLSMENKCGIYVLQNINKSSQVVPKIFCFCIFGFTSVGLQVCLCLCVGFLKFASYACPSVGWVFTKY